MSSFFILLCKAMRVDLFLKKPVGWICFVFSFSYNSTTSKDLVFHLIQKVMAQDQDLFYISVLWALTSYYAIIKRLCIKL